MSAGQEPATPPAAPATERRRGRSTGFKIAVGCAAVAGVAVLLATIAVVAGVSFLGSKAGEWRAALEGQAELGERIEAIERAHAFSPPPRGEIPDDRFDVFLSVTEESWEAVRQETAVLEALAERAGSGGPGASLRAGFGSLQGLGRIRIAVGDVFADHGMPPSEYGWLAGAYLRAAYPDEAAGGSVPEANVGLAERHRARLDALGEDGDEVLPVIVFIVATMGGDVVGSLPEWAELSQPQKAP